MQTQSDCWQSLMTWIIAVGVTVCTATAIAAENDDEQQYAIATSCTRWLDGPGGVKIKMLVEHSTLGGDEVEIGEITFPAGYKKSPRHRHGQVEIFYVRSGRLGHEVNGVKKVIESGMVGIVRPGDRVVHSVESDEPVHALVIWTPRGEAEALINAGIFKARPIEE